MNKPRWFFCGETKTTPSSSYGFKLSTEGRNKNVNVKLENVTRAVPKALSERMLDLLEIASYVFAADCRTDRGARWEESASIEPWGRTFKFSVGVRDLAFWKQGEIQQLLREALEFMTDDSYSFVFRKHVGQESYEQLYCGVTDTDWSFSEVERVLMFSGGLDSLAGAIQTAEQGQPLVLVTHVPVGTIHSRTAQLIDQLRKSYKVPIIHVPVWVNKKKGLDREHTQRSRTLLFSALGVVIAESIKAKGVRFFENGVVSINLPVGQEVVGARASRTTHPEVLRLLESLYSRILEREFSIDNPFIYKTKTEVIKQITDANQSSLISLTSSCAHLGFYKSSVHWHCGMCSQCIDRKIAIVSAGQESSEVTGDYAKDVFIGEREDGYEKNIAVDYIRHGLELASMNEMQVLGQFNSELSRAVNPGAEIGEQMRQLASVHIRHGRTVEHVLREVLAEHFSEWNRGAIPANSLLGYVLSREHLTASWRRYAAEISEILRLAIPVAYEKDKPRDEKEFQRLVDAILLGKEKVRLERENPLMRWGSRFTKPDWSIEELCLWIEAKYVKDKKSEARCLGEIAEDITKYGDIGRKTLFVVYDPNRSIIKEDDFSEHISRRPDKCSIVFVR